MNKRPTCRDLSTSLWACSLAILAGLALPTAARSQGDDFGGAFHHLEQAVKALHESGRHEHAEKLADITREFRQNLTRSARKADDQERERMQWELKTLRLAKAGYAEAGKKAAVEVIERAMHARELILAGRRDREAQQVIERAPGPLALAEYLGGAARILAEYGAKEQAAACKKLSAEFARRAKRHEKRRAADQERAAKQREMSAERRAGLHQLEVLVMAAKILKEARRPDAAEAMQRAARAMKVRLGGREATGSPLGRDILEHAPGRGQTAELLQMTAKILAEQGKLDRAEMVAKVAAQFRPRQPRVRQPRQRDDRMGMERRLDELSARVRELSEVLRELQSQVERLARERIR